MQGTVIRHEVLNDVFVLVHNSGGYSAVPKVFEHELVDTSSRRAALGCTDRAHMCRRWPGQIFLQCHVLRKLTQEKSLLRSANFGLFKRRLRM